MAAKAKAPRWRDNTGKPPRAKEGARAVVELANGRVCGDEPVSKEAPAGWPITGGRPPTRWTLTGSPFDIARFYVLGEK